MKKQKEQKCRTPKFDVDGLMLSMVSSLIRDFRTALDEPALLADFYSLIKERNIAGIRAYDFAIDLESQDVSRTKALLQIQGLLKRYRFRDDVYTDEELESLTLQKYEAVQHRLSRLNFDCLPSFLQEILKSAAEYVAKVLGPYDDEECRSLAKFGKRATVGVTARDACEAARWEWPISGSKEQIDWFDSEMSQNVLVQQYFAGQDHWYTNTQYTSIDTLNLVLVPKTFKSLRVILPNTTIGSYISAGIGEMFRKRLKRAGYDIRRLQQRHRHLAKVGSVSGKLVTADLSSASDSITDALVQRLLPPDWYEVLNRTRIRKIAYDSHVTETLSFCTMGIGYTFPLQTLIFLSLLKAIERRYENHRRGLISVYGDDMIYHQRLHKYVLIIFSWLGFEVNVDKTFAKGYFRESCGGDFFRGVDVRPFSPKDGPSKVGKVAYEALLYKSINGLLRRWSEHEVSGTLQMLCHELSKVVMGIKLVPQDFADDSGVRCCLPCSLEFLKGYDVRRPKHVGHGLFRFVYLRSKSKERKEDRHGPYYWAAVRCTSSTDRYDCDREIVPALSCSPLTTRINRVCGCDRDNPSALANVTLKTWTRKVENRVYRFRRTEARVFVPHTGHYSRQEGTSCFEDRS